MSPPFLTRVKAVLAVVPALALFASPLAHAEHMSGFLQHNAEHSIHPFSRSPDSRFDPPCSVTVQHGNVYGAAYAKIKINTTNCIQVGVTVTALRNGQIVSKTERINFPRRGEWYQATEHYANIIGSSFYAIDKDRGSIHWTYAGI